MILNLCYLFLVSLLTLLLVLAFCLLSIREDDCLEEAFGAWVLLLLSGFAAIVVFVDGLFCAAEVLLSRSTLVVVDLAVVPVFLPVARSLFLSAVAVVDLVEMPGF